MKIIYLTLFNNLIINIVTIINSNINLKYLIILIIFDFITGIFKAFIKRKINSTTNLKGLLKKISYFVIISVSIILDNILLLNMFLVNMVLYFLILNEIISILENCQALGMKYPKVLINSLEVFNSRIDKEEKINKKTKE